MSSYENIIYRLRAGSPMPVSTGSDFVIHSFMAEKHSAFIDTCATTLLSSRSFRGQGGGFSSANYARIPVSGQAIFKATENENVVYVEELD